jgi:hypothetical protein
MQDLCHGCLCQKEIVTAGRSSTPTISKKPAALFCPQATDVFMHRQKSHSQSPAKTAFEFLIRIIIYTALVTAYGFFVLLSLRGWLKQEFDAHRTLYATIALPLIIAQALLLDFVTMGLRKLGWGKPK